MGKKRRAHRERVAKNLERPYRNVTLEADLQYLKCGKCGHVVSGSGATTHLKQCQPGGVRCVKCHRLISADEFWAHLNACRGMVPTTWKPVTIEGGKQWKLKI